MITSCTSSAFRPARSTAALMAVAPSWAEVNGLRTPCMPPMGVRATEAMTISDDDMAILDWRSLGDPHYRPYGPHPGAKGPIGTIRMARPPLPWHSHRPGDRNVTGMEWALSREGRVLRGTRD